jgi:hypothetical protein
MRVLACTRKDADTTGHEPVSCRTTRYAAEMGLHFSCAARLGWTLPEGLTGETLEDRLYPPPAVARNEHRARPDWATVHRELRRPG